MSRVIAFDCRDDEATVYPNRKWESPDVTNNSTFYQDDYINLEARTVFHFTADGITPAMAAQMPEGKDRATRPRTRTPTATTSTDPRPTR